MLQLKSAYRDGTTHIVMSALEFMQRLAALVERPRLHLISFHGVLAPNARRHLAVFLAHAQNATATVADGTVTHSAPVGALTWLWYGLRWVGNERQL